MTIRYRREVIVKKLSIIVICSILFTLFWADTESYADTLAPLDVITVDTTTDSNDPTFQACTAAANDCSLRGAIIASNSTVDEVNTISVPAGTYTLSVTVIAGDDQYYGDLDITAPVTIEGAGTDATIIRAADNDYTGIDRVMEIANTTGTVKLSDLTLMWGRVTSSQGGAGIYQSASTSTVLLERVAINENTVLVDIYTNGGGIKAAGDITLIDSTLMFNNTFGAGGGITADPGSYLSINRSTIAYNSARWGGGIYYLGNGGVLQNSTISANSATYVGGGIYKADNGSELIIAQSTITGNQVFGGLTGWAIYDNGQVNAINSILAADYPGTACYNGINSGYNNISTDSSCGTSYVMVVAYTLLGELSDNGGYTQTHPLLGGSPAIDSGNNPNCMLTDQRGVHRPIDGDGDGIATCDIGAFEKGMPLFLPLLKKR
jgi:hypothetical protein